MVAPSSAIRQRTCIQGQRGGARSTCFGKGRICLRHALLIGSDVFPRLSCPSLMGARSPTCSACIERFSEPLEAKAALVDKLASMRRHPEPEGRHQPVAADQRCLAICPLLHIPSGNANDCVGSTAERQKKRAHTIVSNKTEFPRQRAKIRASISNVRHKRFSAADHFERGT